MKEKIKIREQSTRVGRVKDRHFSGEPPSRVTTLLAVTLSMCSTRSSKTVFRVVFGKTMLQRI